MDGGSAGCGRIKDDPCFVFVFDATTDIDIDFGIEDCDKCSMWGRWCVELGTGDAPIGREDRRRDATVGGSRCETIRVGGSWGWLVRCVWNNGGVGRPRRRRHSEGSRGTPNLTLCCRGCWQWSSSFAWFGSNRVLGRISSFLCHVFADAGIMNILVVILAAVAVAFVVGRVLAVVTRMIRACDADTQSTCRTFVPPLVIVVVVSSGK
jgi:hypothetical protein